MSATPAPLVLLTRASALARWQADLVTARLEAAGHAVTQRLITSQGDADRTTPLSTEALATWGPLYFGE